jgi:hypothetical protein
MQTASGTLTVFFEDPFWIGVYEREADGKLEASKITFGAEPKDYEVYQFLMDHWFELSFSPPVRADARRNSPANPKRMQRAIQKQMEPHGIGTKSQQALKLQHEENKEERKAKTKAEREAEQERQFEIQQRKKKEKKRGKLFSK